MKNEHKMILGYVLGGFLVMVLVPSGIYIATAFLGAAFETPVITIPWLRIVLAALLLVVGFSFGLWSIVIQNVVGKGGPLEIANIEISPKTKNLVVSGPYRYTRNPMLFGTFLIYLGFATCLNSAVAVLIVIALVVFMLVVVIRLEEKRLLRDFGNQYEEYRRKTSRFFPWFPA